MKKSIYVMLFSFFMLVALPITALFSDQQRDQILNSNLSPEEKEIMLYLDEQPEVMEEIVNSFAAEVSQMSEEEQEAIFNQLANDMQRFQNELGHIFEAEDETKIEEAVKEKPKEVIKEKPKPKPIEKISPETQEKIEQVLRIIRSIQNLTQNFLVLAQGIPGASDMIERWAQQKKIDAWPLDEQNPTKLLPWNKVEKRIQEFTQQINKLEQHDPKDPKQYKYINFLIETESLINNLNVLNYKLEEFVPRIELPTDDILPKVSSETKSIIQKILNALLEAIYTTKIPDEINEVIQKYEPRQQELFEEETLAEQKALEEAKKPKRYLVTQAVGKEPEPYEQPSFDEPYFPQFDDFAFDIPKAKKPAPISAKKGPSTGRPSSKKPATKTPAKPKPKKPADKKVSEDRAAKDFASNFSSSLSKAGTQLSVGNLYNIQKTLNQAASKNSDQVNFALVDEIIDATKNIRTASSAARALRNRLRRLTPDQKKSYANEVKDVYAAYRDDIYRVAQQIKKVNKGKLHNNLQYAYFGGFATPADSVKGSLKVPANLEDLAEAITALTKVVRGF